MTLIQRGILTLIRSALTGQAMPLPEGFSLEEAEEMILKHQIVGLAYEGAVLCGVSKAEPVMSRLFQRYCQVMIRSNNQMSALDKLYSAFEENGIDYLPVKGCISKQLYPNPAMRTMGDADVLIRMEQYDVIRPIMLELGYTEGEQADHALVWETNSLCLELHRRLVPSYDTDYYAYIGSGWQRAIEGSGCRYGMREEDHFLFIFIHYAKHYRCGGIGLRQLIDLWIWQQAHPDMDSAYIHQELAKLHLQTFFENTQKTLYVWFQDDPMDEKSQFMTDYIFSSGSWGDKETHLAAGGLRNTQKSGSIHLGRLRMASSYLFPPAAQMAKRYPVLDKTPWLLPLFWPVRWITALLFRRENIRGCQAEMACASADNIQSFEQALQYVGLDFHL